MYSNVAKITDEIGNTVYIFEEESRIQWIPCGWYPTFLLILAFMVAISTAASSEFVRFAGDEVKIEGCGSTRFHAGDRCSLLAEYRATTGCKAEISSRFGSLANEFRIFCLPETVADILISFENIAAIIGFLVSGELIGFLGRKPTLICALFISLSISIGSTFFSHLRNIIFSRAIVSALNALIANVSICFFYESMPPHLRLTLISILNPSYSILVPGLAYLAKEWRFYLRIVSVFSLLATVFLNFSVESIFHSLQSGRFKQAKVDLQKIYGVNGHLDEFTARSIDKIIATEKRFQSTAKTQKCHTYFHLALVPRFSFWASLLIINVLFFAFHANQIVPLQTLFPFDLYLNSISAGIFNSIIVLLFILADFHRKTGRRHLLMSCQIIYAVSAVLIAHGNTYPYLYEISLILNHLSREMGISMCLLIGCEIFPTGVRSHIMGLLLLVEKCTSIYLYGLVTWVFSKSFHQPRILSVFALSTPLLIFTTILLPESKDTPIQLHFPKRKLKKATENVEKHSFYL